MDQALLMRAADNLKRAQDDLAVANAAISTLQERIRQAEDYRELCKDAARTASQNLCGVAVDAVIELMPYVTPHVADEADSA